MKFLKFALLNFLSLSIIANTYIVNNEHSSIKFGISYFKVTTVEGHFSDYLISYETDDKIENIISLKGSIKTNSITTLDKKRDSHLKKPDFFDVKKFPLISFETTSPIKLILDKKQNIIINLTIKDVTKKTPIELIYRGQRIDPWTKATGEYFDIQATLKRSDFGITWNKLIDGSNDFLIGDDVKININIESYHANEKPAFSRFYKEKENFITKTSSDETKYEDVEEQDSKDYSKTEATNNLQKQPTPQKEGDFQIILATIFTSFLIFIPLILAAIFFQKKMSQYLEDKGFSDTLNYIIPSSIIMIILIIIFYFTGPLMGVGRNPILDLFN